MRVRPLPRLVLLTFIVAACQSPSGPGRPGAQAPAGASASAPADSAARGGADIAATAPQPLQRVTVAIVSPSEVFSIPWVGRDTGIFARHGFDVDVPLVTGSPRLIQSLVAGDFDYAMAGVTATLRARMQGADPVILATSINHITQSVIVHPQSGIRGLPELKGRTIGISQIGSEADVFLQLALGLVGLKPEDVSVLQTGGHPQTVAALLTGNLDAGVTGGANLLRAQQIGAVKLAGGKELGILAPGGTLTTTRKFVDRDRAAVGRFMRAYVEAVHYFKTERDDTIRILQAQLGGLPLEEVTYLYDEMNEFLQPLPLVREEAVLAVLEREPEPQARAFPPSEFVDHSFLREIEQSGFVTALYR